MRSPRLVSLALIAISLSLGLSAGCQELQTTSLTPSSPPTSIPTATPSASPSSEPTPAASPSAAPAGDWVPVTSVVDGDTLKVSLNGTIETLRLIGLDTPETVDPGKPVQCFGPEASQRAKDLLSGKRVSLEFDPSQGERDRYNRLLVYVFLEDGTHYNLKMIEDGYAHEYTYSKAYKYQSDFKAAEQRAKDAKRGFWAPETCDGDTSRPAVETTPTPGTTPGPSDVRVIHVEADPPGSDAEGEFVQVKNFASTAANLRGWKLKDEAGQTFTFPEFTLAPGATVTIHICRGSNDTANLYWNQCSAVWNNNGDTAFLYNAAGTLIHSYTYGR